MSEETTAQPQPSIARKIVMFPLSRIIIAMIMVLGTVAVISLIFRPLGHILFPGDERPIAWVSAMWVLSATMVTLAYLAYLRLVERRDLSELSRRHALPEMGIGYGVGALLMIVSFTVIWLAGGYQVTGWNPALVMITPFFASIFTGFFEEILFRGVIFRIVQESLGTWIAVLISALLFGFAHGANPNATLFSSAAIALEAGILLSAVYLYTNRLWMVIGMHAAWNFVQGAVFGVNVSGTNAKGLMQSSPAGNELLSGGAFGIEASLITIVLCTSVGILFLVLSHRKGHFVKPFWRRPKPVETLPVTDTAEEGAPIPS